MRLLAGGMRANPFGSHEDLRERLGDARLGAEGDRGAAALGGNRQPHAPLVDHTVVQTPLGIVRTGVPAMATVDSRANQGALASLGPQHVLELARFQIEATGPVLGLLGGVNVHGLATGGLVNVVETVLARVQNQGLAFVLEHDVLARRGVVVIGIARGFLEVPVQLAGIQVQGDRRRGVQVVAGAPAVGVGITAGVAAIVIIRIRIARTDQDLVVGVINGAGLPGAAAAVLPRVAAPGCEGCRVAAASGVEGPLEVAILRIQTEDAAFNRILATVLANDQKIGIDEGGSAAEAGGVLLGVDELAVPEDLCGILVNRHHAAIGQAHVQAAVANGGAAGVREHGARHNGLVHLRHERPDALAGCAVDLPDRGRVGGQVNIAANGQRRAVQAGIAAAAAAAARQEDPCRFQLGHVVLGDLIQRAVPPGLVGGAMVCAPVLSRAVPDTVGARTAMAHCHHSRCHEQAGNRQERHCLAKSCHCLAHNPS